MQPKVCICCGEPMARKGSSSSRNPNVCSSCSSMADAMDERDTHDLRAAAAPIEVALDSPVEQPLALATPRGEAPALAADPAFRPGG